MATTRSVFITGGGSGLGAAVAAALAEQGWRIGLAGRTAGKLERVAKPLLKTGVDCSTHVLDVSDATALETAIRAFRPTALVNAAAVLGQGSIYEELSPARFAEVLAINVQGSFNACSAAMRLWREAGSAGDIVNVSSLAGIRGMQVFPGFAAYAASKHAVVGLTEALALDGKEHDVRVNCVAPGMMRTDMLGQLGISPQTLPEDIVPTVSFLLDRAASAPISGTTIDIHCND